MPCRVHKFHRPIFCIDEPYSSVWRSWQGTDKHPNLHASVGRGYLVSGGDSTTKISMPAGSAGIFICGTPRACLRGASAGSCGLRTSTRRHRFPHFRSPQANSLRFNSERKMAKSRIMKNNSLKNQRVTSGLIEQFYFSIG